MDTQTYLIIDGLLFTLTLGLLLKQRRTRHIESKLAPKEGETSDPFPIGSGHRRLDRLSLISAFATIIAALLTLRSLH